MNSFEIKYRNSSNEIIKTDKILRVKRKQLTSLILLKEDLIYAFYKNNARVGNVIADSSNWNIIEKISKMLVVVGQEKPGFEVSEIEDDIAEITRIFFTQDITEDGELIITGEPFKPSLISELHQLDYFNSAKKAAKRIMKEAEEENNLIQI